MANAPPRLLHPTAIALVVAVLALIGYEIYRDRAQRDVDAERTAQLNQIDAHTAALRQEAEHLKEQAHQLSEQTERMQRPVQAERRAAEDSRQHFISAANLAEGLQAASSEKTAITEFYLTEGRFPRSNAEVGMLAPEKYTGRSLRSVTLAKNGVMTLAYEDKTGKGTIRLIPEDSNQQGRVTWRCVTASYANIATILPSCEYTNSAGTSGASSTRN